MACPQSTWRKSGSRQKSVASGGCDGCPMVVVKVTVAVAAVISDMMVMVVVQEAMVVVAVMMGGLAVHVEKSI